MKEHLFHAAVRYQMAARRAGTHATKGRAQVSGGGKKPFRQKGTGRARAGTTRAPVQRRWCGPRTARPRSHAHNLPKKVRKATLKRALSRRTEENALTIFDAFALAKSRPRRSRT